MGDLLHSVIIELQENRLYKQIQDFSQKRTKKFLIIYFLKFQNKKA